MQRRPWPLVILALLQILGPIGSTALSAYISRVGFTEMTIAIWKNAGWLEIMEFYALPIAQGGMIFFAKRFGYYVVLLLAALSIYLNIVEWRSAKDLVSLPVFLGTISVNIALIGYLLLPTVRAVFMNPRLRWWENAPRYTVSIPGQISKTNALAHRCSIMDLSIGGAGVQSEDGGLSAGDTILLSWEHQHRTLLLRGTVVYRRNDENSHRYGIEWLRSVDDDERRFSQVIEDLRKERAPLTRTPPSWAEDLRSWWNRAKKSPSAWTPEVPKERKKTP
jgi:hypothetical protein